MKPIITIQVMRLNSTMASRRLSSRASIQVGLSVCCCMASGRAGVAPGSGRTRATGLPSALPGGGAVECGHVRGGCRGGGAAIEEIHRVRAGLDAGGRVAPQHAVIGPELR